MTCSDSVPRSSVATARSSKSPDGSWTGALKP